MVIGLAEIVILALLIGGIVFIGMVVRSLFPRDDKPKRELLTNNQGELVGIGEVLRSEPVRLARKGTFASDALPLEAGVYKIEYQFPENSQVKVDLISARDGDKETIVLKSGSGSLAFTVHEPGRFIVQVEPVDEAAQWAFEFRRM